MERICADELLESVKQAGYEIFKRKQNTTHGIAASVFRIIQAIMIDERSVLPVATLLNGQYGIHDVVLSLPTVVGRNGAESILNHPFTEEETRALLEIAKNVTNVVAEVAQKTQLQA
jgi:L-lactate dehydrogenase